MTIIRLEGVSKRFDSPGLVEGLLSEASQAWGTGLHEILSPEYGRYFSDLRRGEWLAPPGLALDSLSLTIRSGETLAVLGPSGCGKTSLLRVVAGLLRPDAGRVYFDNQDVTEEPPNERRIGMVFQNYALYPHMESRENLAFFFRVHHREEEIPERVHTVSEMMGITFKHLLSRKPPHMSEGERQRVAIARCIVRKPRAFLFDEPLSNLDAKLRMQTRVEIKRLLRRFQTTSLYVTHDQTEAIAIADRIAVMRAGLIEQVGTFGEVYSWPVNAFVAGFVGSPPMNIWPARIEGGSVRVGTFSFPMPTRLKRQPPAGTPVLYGVRPEQMRLDAGGPIELNADWVEPLVAERAQLIRGFVGEFPAIVRIEGEPAGARIGDRLRLGVDPAQLHLFDAQTGERFS